MDQFKKLFERSISMICTNNTKRFSIDMAIEVISKLLTTTVVEMLKNVKFISIKALRLYILLHRMFI